MKMKTMLCALLAAMLLMASAQAVSLEKAWMEYEDYSGARAEQQVEGEDLLRELEKMLMTAKDHPDKLDGCTLNCTLFCMADNGEIYDFACATDGCPFIQSRKDEKVYNLGMDYQRFWEIFAEVKTGMGFDASDVFDW